MGGCISNCCLVLDWQGLACPPIRSFGKAQAKQDDQNIETSMSAFGITGQSPGQEQSQMLSVHECHTLTPETLPAEQGPTTCIHLH